MKMELRKMELEAEARQAEARRAEREAERETRKMELEMELRKIELQAVVEGIMVSANQRSRSAVAGETSDPSTPGVARGIPAGSRPSKRAMFVIP